MPSSTFNLKSQHSLWNCKVERTNAQSLCIFNELLVQPVAFLHNLCSSRMIVASESNARNLIILMCWKKRLMSVWLNLRKIKFSAMKNYFFWWKLIWELFGNVGIIFWRLTTCYCVADCVSLPSIKRIRWVSSGKVVCFHKSSFPIICKSKITHLLCNSKDGLN